MVAWLMGDNMGGWVMGGCVGDKKRMDDNMGGWVIGGCVGDKKRMDGW
jgi:hypothetical protein